MPRYSDLPYIGPPRSHTGTQSKLAITIHSTENSASARNEAAYARNRTDGTSSHYYADGREVVQSLSTDFGANHAGSAWPNERSISYEFTGRASWSRSQWLASINWSAAARAIARDCRHWGIPARWVTVAQLRNHAKGFHTHDDCRRAFGGTTHHDPGPGFPKDHLLTLVKKALEGDDDMPRLISLGAKQTLQVPDSSWTTLKFDTEYSDPDKQHADTGFEPTFLRTHAFFDATVSVAFDGLPEGTTVKARLVEAAASGDGYKTAKSYPPMEMHSTAGETQLVLNQVGSLDKGHRLRAQVRLSPGVPGAVAKNARVRCLYWER